MTANISSELKLLLSVCGIYVCYIGYGMCQEALYEYHSPIDGEKFSFTLFFLFIQCVVNCIISGLGILCFGSSANKKPTSFEYMKVGFSYILAMLCSNESLKYVSYPTQALGKSCKMIPVMLFGFLLRKKIYSLKELLTVGLITIGIYIFQSGKAGGKSSTYGLVLLFMSLVLDGVTGAGQDAIQESYRLNTHELMFNINLWAVVLLTVLVTVSGQAQTGLAFCLKNQDVVYYILAAALTSAGGQNFIFFALSNFNSLVVATITTTRKFFTILVSVFYFGHALKSSQWIGVLLVFSGLSIELHSKYTSKTSKKNH